MMLSSLKKKSHKQKASTHHLSIFLPQWCNFNLTKPLDLAFCLQETDIASKCKEGHQRSLSLVFTAVCNPLFLSNLLPTNEYLGVEGMSCLCLNYKDSCWFC